MTDGVDTTMGELFEGLSTVVDSGLREVDINDLVRFETLDTAVPWRATEQTWTEVKPYPRVTSAISRRTARVQIEEAHEVRMVLDVDLDRIVIDRLKDRLEEAATDVARAYAARVLELVVTGKPILRGGAYTADRVARQLTSAGRWRLIGFGPIAASTKAAGTAEVSDPDGALVGTHARALLVDLLTGPRVEQLDTPALSWLRGTNSTVRLVISRRFFFSPGQGSVAFT